MMLAYLIASLMLVGGVALSPRRGMVQLFSALFYGLQVGVAVLLFLGWADHMALQFFRFDNLGLLFFALMSLVSGIAFCQSNAYLDSESLHDYKLYNIALILLCLSAAGVYFADHLAVTWIFLEATTLSTAGLVYHRRNARSLEATWKYIFVCSTGIAVAYLGILLLSTASQGGDLSYAHLAQVIAQGNPLYLKMAFLFIFIGYSCKLEVFPLYPIGVDANYAAPTPASAVISTVIVNAGFVALFRVYRLFSNSPVSGWISGVLITAGLLSVLIAAVYLRRTNNYKRFLSYSTVENMGIVLIGLGVGGVALFAALFHLLAHTLIKSGLFFHLAQIGRRYGSYRINRIGDYVHVNELGGMAILLGTISLLAFPPSALFISELLLFKQIIADRMWVLLILLALLLCFVMYSLTFRVLQLCYQPVDHTRLHDNKGISPWITWIAFLLILLSVVIGIVQPLFLTRFIYTILAL